MAGIPESLKGRSYTRVADWTREELEIALDLADELKASARDRRELRVLPGRTIGLIFHKPSTRTRVGFEVGIAELGGMALFLPAGRAAARAWRELSRHGARPLALPLRAHDPHVRSGGGRRVRRACGDPGDQRPHRPGASPAGTRRRDDDARALRRARRGQARVPRGREQRLPLADAHRSALRDGLHGGDAARLRARLRVRRGRARRRRANGGSIELGTDPREARRRRRRALHRRLDEHGPGGRARATAPQTSSRTASTASC